MLVPFPSRSGLVNTRPSLEKARQVPGAPIMNTMGVNLLFLDPRRLFHPALEGAVGKTHLKL